MDSTSYSAYAVSSLCHVVLIAWCLWGVHQLDITDVSQVNESEISKDPTAFATASLVPKFALLMPQQVAEEVGQLSLPTLPELDKQPLSSQFITPQIFQATPAPSENNENQTPSIHLPTSAYQLSAGGAAVIQGQTIVDVDSEIKSISEFWHTINSIILSNQYRKVWKKRYHDHLPRHRLLLRIGIHNSAITSIEVLKGTGNQDFDDIFNIWFQDCVERRELHGPPVADGQYPVEFLIR